MRPLGIRASVLATVAGFLVFAGALFSCSQGKPEIRDQAVQLLSVEAEGGGFVQRLSAFVFFDDPDGPADLGPLTVTHEATGMTWTVEPEALSVRLRGKERWVGSSQLAGPGNGPFPSGGYSLSVSDLAGNEGVGRFEIGAQAFPVAAPYRLDISGGRWALSPRGPRTEFTRLWFILLDSGLKPLQSWRVPAAANLSASGSTQVFTVISREARYVQCLAENEAGSAGVLLAPVELR